MKRPTRLIEELHDLQQGTSKTFVATSNGLKFNVTFHLTTFFSLFNFDQKSGKRVYGLGIHVQIEDVLCPYLTNVLEYTPDYKLAEVVKESVDADFNGDESYHHDFPDDGLLRPSLTVSNKMLSSKWYKDFKKRVLSATERLNAVN